MGRRIGLGVSMLAALAALAAPPWLAWREARRQAFDAETTQALAYANDVLHRADTTARQIVQATAELARGGEAPCSQQQLATMRRIALGSSYMQAIGLARGGVLVCSSLGGAPIPLGSETFSTASGVKVYTNVPIGGAGHSPVLAVERGGFAALVHRDMPVDTSTAMPEGALGILYIERQRLAVSRGDIDPAWLDRLGTRRVITFTERGRLVAMVRSRYDSLATVAALPLARVERRAGEIATRLVPAGALFGAVLAAAVLLFARRRMSLEAALAAALRRRELFLHYQPIVNLQTGACVGAEALLRWRRDGEMVGPDVFIPVAERSNLIVRLTEQVVRMVGEDAGAFLAAHPDFHVAINLSAADLRSPAIAKRLGAMLAGCGALPSNLIVEITERGFLHLETAREVIAALRARAIGVAIDDFGTGYSSLSYLQTLDLDFLKIDRAFVEAIGTGAPTSNVVNMIIDMARAMRLTMIAEGIEDPVQAAYLRERGVEFAQGWLFGKPMPFADIASRAEESRRKAAQAGPAKSAADGGAALVRS
jgi:sensor c-di-GMP phosphodiesterase-like protein